MKKWKYLFLTAILFVFCACGNPSAQNIGSEDTSSQESSSVLDDEQSSSLSGDGCVYSPEDVQIKTDLEKKEYLLTNVSCTISYGIDTTARWDFCYKNILTLWGEDSIDKSGGMLLFCNYKEDLRDIDLNSYITPLFEENKHLTQGVITVNGDKTYVGDIIPVAEFLGGGEYEVDFVDDKTSFHHSEVFTIPAELFEGDKGTIILSAFLYGGQMELVNVQAVYHDLIIIDYEVEGDTVRIIDIRK